MTPATAPPRTILLTPPGRGAVATLLVEGPGALQSVERVFSAKSGRPLASLPTDRLVLGHVGGPSGEEVVLRRRSDGSVELHCHGGEAAVGMVQRLLAEHACRPATWQDWAAGSLEDPLQSAALVALAEARTPRTAAILLDQYHGALRRAIETIRGHVLASEIGLAQREVATLRARADLGLHLTRPWRVVLTGPPNTGKSSLLNALLGYRRAIVDPDAGTTRDAVTATTALEGWPIEFSDTAGVRDSDSPLERAGIAVAQERVADADLVLLVLEATGERLGEDAAGVLVAAGHQPDSLVRPLARGQRAPLVVFNTSDLAVTLDAASFPGLLTSALYGDGVPGLAQAICKRLVPDPPEPGQAVPFAVAQIDWIDRVDSALTRGDLTDAAHLLAQ